jgi:hypothetical protein
MTPVQSFMKAAGTLDDQELAGLIRGSLLAQDDSDRMRWLKQAEAALDGYGGERHLAQITRIGDILHDLAQELRGESPAALTA